MAVKKSKKPAKQIQRPDLRRHYRYQHTPLDLSNTDIRLLLVRSRQMPTVIDDLVESVNWTFSPESPVVTGNVAFIQDGFQTVHVSEGDLLICQYSVGDRWPEVWRMRLRNVKRDLSPTDSRQFELAEDLIAWAESTDNFHYGKSKARPHGWFAHEILIDVARRYRLPVGKVCRGSHRITGISGEMTPMEAVRRAYALERRATGKRFVIEWRYGKLNILPQKRGDDMLSLGPLIEGANISRQERDEKYANAVIIRGAVKGKDGKRKKVRVSYVNEQLARRDGLVRKTLAPAGAKTADEMLARAKRYVAKHAARKRTLTQVQHPAVAILRRGDVVQITLPEVGISGKQGQAFVTGGTFAKSGGQFDMTLDLTFDDPYVLTKADRKSLNKAARQRKAAKRKTKAKNG